MGELVMLNEDHYAAFDAWLQTNYESPGTVAVVSRCMRQIARRGPEVENPVSRDRHRQFHVVWDIYAYYCQTEGIEPQAYPPPPIPPGTKRRIRENKKRVSREPAIPKDEYKALLAEIEACNDLGVEVLHVIATTGLRTGDVLRVTRGALEAGLKHPTGRLPLVVKTGKTITFTVDGARPAWVRLARAMRLMQVEQASETCVTERATTARITAASSSAPRKAVDRLLKRLAEDAGVSGRVHLHRLRRSVAVYGLVATGNKQAVQNLLGHANVADTDVYVEDARALISADVLKKIGLFDDQEMEE